MTTTQDELAGVVDLFGALTRGELTAALGELAFKQGQDVDESALRSAIETAVEAYALVEYEPDEGDDTLVAVGPTAFATLPPNAEDLPHILDFDRRSVGRERLASQVSQRLTSEAEAAVDSADTERATELLDVSYDLEAWAAIDASGVRSRLEPVLPQD